MDDVIRHYFNSVHQFFGQMIVEWNISPGFVSFEWKGVSPPKSSCSFYAIKTKNKRFICLIWLIWQNHERPNLSTCLTNKVSLSIFTAFFTPLILHSLWRGQTTDYRLTLSEVDPWTWSSPEHSQSTKTGFDNDLVYEQQRLSRSKQMLEKKTKKRGFLILSIYCRFMSFKWMHTFWNGLKIAEYKMKVWLLTDSARAIETNQIDSTWQPFRKARTSFSCLRVLP